MSPAGVRNGDPAALEGLCARRGAAVLAFCNEVCDAEVATRAAAEAFARFRAAVAILDDLSVVDPDELLLGATRHAAASVARVPETPPPGGLLRGLAGRGRTEACAFVPELLVARAAGVLGESDAERLAKHLEHCPACREVEAAFERAELAYRDPGDTPVPPAAARAIVAALTAAAPIVAAAPEPEPEPEQPLDEAPIDAPTEQFDALEEEEEEEEEEEPNYEVGDDDADHLEDDEDEDWPDEDEAYPDDEPLVEEQPSAVTETGPTGLPRTRRRPHVHWPTGGHGASRTIGLPAGVVAVAILGAMAVAGVFGGDDPAPPTGSATSAEPLFPVSSAPTPAHGTAAAAAAEIARQARLAQRRAARTHVKRRRTPARQAPAPTTPSAPPATQAPTPTPTPAAPPSPSGAVQTQPPPAGGTATGGGASPDAYVPAG